MLASVPFVLATITVLPTNSLPGDRVIVAVICALLGAGGLLSWRAPHLISPWCWSAAPFIATGIIAGLNVLTFDATTGAQLYFLWPVLYAAMYLSRRVLCAVLVTVLTGEATTVFSVFEETGRAWADLMGMTFALSGSSIVVMILRERAHRLMRELEDQALADPLTGLPNRRSFDRELADAESWARRSGGSLALISIDLDRFKDINDTWGHAAGDKALQKVAAELLSVTHNDATAARLGGDEFVLLLRTGREDAVNAADALRHAVARSTGVPGGPPGLSIGVAVLPDDADTAELLLSASDAALYRAKSAGRAQSANGERQAAAHPPLPAGARDESARARIEIVDRDLEAGEVAAQR